MSKDSDLRDVFKAFIEKHKKRFSTDSHKVYESTFANYLKFKPGANKFANINELRIKYSLSGIFAFLYEF